MGSTFIAEKKKLQKKFTIFFPYTKIAKQKNSQQAKFRIKNFAKYIILQTSNTKEIRENIVKKIFAKENDKKIFPKKKFVEKNFRKENFSKKKIRKQF